MAEEPEDGAPGDFRGPFAALVAKALPTSRHARMLFDAVAELLGDAGRLATWDDGRRRALYRRDERHADQIAPWPLMELREGERLAGVLEITTNLEPVYVQERTLAAVRMGGLRRGEITFGEAPVAVHAEFSDEGMRVFPETGHGLVVGGDEDTQENLCRRILASFALEHAGNTAVERLAGPLALLDPGRDNPARVGWDPEDDGRPEGRWMGGWKAMAEALWEGRIPDSARWIFTRRDAEGTVGASDAAPPTRPLAVAELSAVEEIPRAWRRAGFGRWLRLLGLRGHPHHALVRGTLPGPVTLVGQRLVGALDPGELDALLDWIHLALGEELPSHGWRPPEMEIPAHVELPEGFVMPALDHAYASYGPFGPGDAFVRDREGLSAGFEAGWLEGAGLADRIVRIVRV